MILLQARKQRFRYPTKPLNERTVVAGDAQKGTQSVLVSRHRNILDRCQLTGVRTDAVGCHLVSQELDLVRKELALRSLECEIILL